ncbi:MAG: hypothetical protein M1482_13490 [Chloroflexi bacterium]|nr:hypothetical protein [Chloroflexota bacterium]
MTPVATAVVLSLALVAGGLLLGRIVESIILARMKSIAKRTQWAGDDRMVSALRGMLTTWFGLAGVFAATFALPLSPDVVALARNLTAALGILSATVFASRIAGDLVSSSVRRSEGILPSASIFANLTRLR